MDADRDAELDTRGVAGVVGAVGGRLPDHERAQRHPAETTLTDPILQPIEYPAFGQDIDAGKRDESIRVSFGKRGDRVVGDESFAAAAVLIEAGDHRPLNPGRIQVGEDLLVATGELRCSLRVLFGSDVELAEDPQVSQQLVGQVRTDMVHDLA
jgi:hypothetical protein